MHARWRTSIVGIIFLILLAGCGGGGKSAGKVVVDEGPVWLKDAKSFLSTSHVGNDVDELAGIGSRGKVTKLIEDAPKQSVTTEQTQTLARLRAVRDFYAAIDSASSAATTRWEVASSSLPALAQDSAKVSLVQRASDRLVEHGKDMVKDVACDLAWGQMKPTEQTAISNQVASTGYVRAVPQEVEGIETQARDAAISTIKSAAVADFLKLFARADVVDWFMYASGLYDKAQEVAGDGTSVITTTDGSVTHALVYYAKLCLVPPKAK